MPPDNAAAQVTRHPPAHDMFAQEELKNVAEVAWNEPMKTPISIYQDHPVWCPMGVHI